MKTYFRKGKELTKALSFLFLGGIKMDIGRTRFVDFDKYCVICKNWTVASDEEPCNECLTNCVNEHSSKPINYK